MNRVVVPRQPVYVSMVGTDEGAIEQFILLYHSFNYYYDSINKYECLEWYESHFWLQVHMVFIEVRLVCCSGATFCFTVSSAARAFNIDLALPTWANANDCKTSSIFILSHNHQHSILCLFMSTCCDAHTTFRPFSDTHSYMALVRWVLSFVFRATSNIQTERERAHSRRPTKKTLQLTLR